MPVADRIREAIDKLNQGDPINALIQVVIAVDATASKEYPGERTGFRCRKFFRDNQGFITRVGLGKLEILGPLQFEVAGKLISFEDVLYKLVRCTLLHEGNLSEEVEITERPSIGKSKDGRRVVLPISMIWALIMTVITSEVNANQRLPSGYTVSIGSQTLPLNDFWGKRMEIYVLVCEQNK